MKPDQLNRLIRVNTRMQPWFLRNTSELYESAVRTYYEHNRHSRFRAENVGPLRRVKKSQEVPSPAEIYPRSHVLQADQLLHTMKQASQPRSMSFSAARPYASAYGPGFVGRRNGSSSCSSASSRRSSRTEIMVGSLRKSKARRERKRSLQKSRDSSREDMGGMFSARSMSLPPLPAMMPPSRQHHMAAMAKTALSQPTRVPRGEGDCLMPVDAALKRRISVLSHLESSGRSTGGRQPSEMRFRFQTLGDRVKQFEYIQFADGPVATYAFNRSQRRPITSTAHSPRSRLEDSADITATRRLDVRQQPRHLSFHNVLHANYRQRSRSLESGAVQLMESLSLAPLTRPETPLGPRGIGEYTRGSSLDSSSRTSLKTGTSTVTWSNTLGRNPETFPDDPGNRSAVNFGYSKSSEETSGDWDAKPGEDWCKYPRSSSSLGTGFGSNLTLAETTSRGNFGISSGPEKKIRSIGETSGGEASGSTAGSSEKCKAETGSFSGKDEPSRATVAPVRRLQLQQRSLQTSAKVEEEPITPFEVKNKPVEKKMKLVSQQDKPRVTKVISNQVSRSSHRSFFQPSEEPDLPAVQPPQSKVSREEKPQKKPQKEQKREPSLKGANQLLVASASQVSAYKRAFRTQQQVLKAEILHQQAQHLQQSEKNEPTEQAKQTPKLRSHRGSIPNTNRSTIVRGAKAPPLTKGVSKPGAGTKGLELKKKAFQELPVKTKAAPVTAHLTAKRTAQMTAAKKGSMKMETSTGGGGGGAVAGRRAVTEPAVATKTRRSALTLAAQQQQSRSGNSLLGFRRETVNRAAAALLQRRDADEPLSQLPLQSQSQSQSPSAQQRRQFHFPHPPWRPSY
ncbi:uncharacterized protein [Drosophila takahashii]|uniref:uncharacterized protein n=1 Tax=Drosophila takahashii TaxID=29030 RepID=UPI0038994441